MQCSISVCLVNSYYSTDFLNKFQVNALKVVHLLNIVFYEFLLFKNDYELSMWHISPFGVYG